jgi:hypothetical protein
LTHLVLELEGSNMRLRIGVVVLGLLVAPLVPSSTAGARVDREAGEPTREEVAERFDASVMSLLANWAPKDQLVAADQAKQQVTVEDVGSAARQLDGTDSLRVARRDDGEVGGPSIWIVADQSSGADDAIRLIADDAYGTGATVSYVSRRSGEVVGSLRTERTPVAKNLTPGGKAAASIAGQGDVRAASGTYCTGSIYAPVVNMYGYMVASENDVCSPLPIRYHVWNATDSDTNIWRLFWTHPYIATLSSPSPNPYPSYGSYTYQINAASFHGCSGSPSTPQGSFAYHTRMDFFDSGGGYGYDDADTPFSTLRCSAGTW